LCSRYQNLNALGWFLPNPGRLDEEWKKWKGKGSIKNEKRVDINSSFTVTQTKRM
jgi:hypothetical protein